MGRDRALIVRVSVRVRRVRLTYSGDDSMQGIHR